MEEKKRKGYKTQEQQNEAMKRYRNTEKGKEVMKKARHKSSCKKFIKEYATIEDLEEIDVLISEKMKELKK